MIILDPDLEPDPSPPATAAKTSIASGAPALPKNHRITSARTLARFLAEAQAAVRLKGEVSVLLTTDANIRRLNRQFRGKNKATDVLSFPADPIPGLKAAEAQAGDLAISVPTALKQAIEQGHPLATEIKVLILHGLLHLAGYDHEADEGQMARRERLLRGKLKLPQGLIERATVPEPATRNPAKKIPSKAPVLKGHGISRAAKGPKRGAASHAEGRFSAKKAVPQGLKPRNQNAGLAARLKSCPDASCLPEGVFQQPVKSRSFKAPAKAKRP
jgi:probable rRNA maturation factor